MSLHHARTMQRMISGRLRRKGIISHEHTNENLEAIVAGLDVHPDDIVLAVCGSGDQSFALLEKAGKVLSVDNYYAQLEYAKNRAELLHSGNYKAFLSVKHEDETCKGSLARRNSYFSQKGRLKRIRDSLGNLHFILGDVFDAAMNGQNEFSNVYLSNVFAHGYESVEPYYRLLNQIAHNLPQGGLIYISNQKGIESQAKYEYVALTYPDELQIDTRLTELARSLERCWTPIVYRRA